ncbi:MAG: periplasmic heavy metal sensor [Proteobacteria bacterium]|nr:periplasmic heavy metal sensor [Pseudomonadota bacterium]
MKLLLGISLVLNVFLLGAAASAVVFGKRWMHEHRELGQPSPLTIAARSLDPAAHETLKTKMRAEALVVRPDLLAAREARRQAAELAAAPTFDRAAVAAKLAEARTDETRARVALEGTLLDVMQSLTPDQRAKLAPALKGRPPKPPRHGRGGHDGAPPAPASPPAAK